MNSFWSSLYDNYKDRRYGILFLTALMAFLGVLAVGAVLGAVFSAFDLQDYWLQALPGAGFLAAAWIWRGMRRARAKRQNRSRYASLSRDELRVARSKLVKGQSLKKI
ncbi:MAG: hypothetical protein ABSC01_05060 [Verrucomicrobiota bacterium]|jgi:uncharacterized membrane protein YfcA